MSFYLSACSKQSTVNQTIEYFTVEDLDLYLPKLPGWVRDHNLTPENNAQGGLLLRLLRESSVPGSPRIEVTMTNPTPTPLILETFLIQSLQDINKLTGRKDIILTSFNKKPCKVANLEGFILTHEFTNTNDNDLQLAISQISLLLVKDGRGIAITAAGRTELFTPFSKDIQEILEGVQTKNSLLTLH